MAKFYPTFTRDFHGSEGERLVYQSLERLGDEYVVFHSYRWLGGYGQRRSEGEADFIILHPKKGILVIEVKAGGISYRDGQWWQTNRSSGKEKRIDPLGQAAESQYRLQHLIRTKFSAPYPLIGRAAWFPSVVVPQSMLLPAEANVAIVLDETGLDDAAKALDRAYTYWAKNIGHSSGDCSGKRFSALISLLMPELRLVPTISCEARENESVIVQLTDRQSSILHFLSEQPTAAIHGPAGTGKTLLAVEKAKMLAAEGEKVLYLCFNEFLLEYLRSKEYSDLITFHNLRTLAEELAPDEHIPVEKIVAFLEQYLEDGFADDSWQYPNIVVDEGQDIPDLILEHLSFLAELNEGIFYAFYDRNQYIMNKNYPKWLDKKAECRLVLHKNCRNTSEIAATVSNLIGIKRNSYINDVHGMKPEALLCKGKEDLRLSVAKFVKDMLAQNLKAEDIVILTVRSTQNSLLHDVKEIGKLRLATEPQSGEICFTSVRKFKGLEAKAVLIIDMPLSKLSDPLWQRLFYVGATRARACLKVIFIDDVGEDRYGQILSQLAGNQEKTEAEDLFSYLSLEKEK